MRRSPPTTAAALFLTMLASCSTATGGGGAPTPVQPGAPGEETRPVAVGQVADRGRPPYTEADVRFMQGMILHHRQALAMSDLVPARSDRDDVRLLARRIEISQESEIAMMARWLEERGEEVPGPDAPHAHHGAGGEHALMPGMLTAEEMARLAAARGPEFDRLFLEYMIRHHQGALVMVDELFSRAGSGQDGDVFQLAADIAGDQRIEIDRMQRMLAAVR